jgi:hypothetical protein
VILEAIRSTWELPVAQGALVALAVLAAGVVAWLGTVGALRRFGPPAPWWAVDLSGVCGGLAAGFLVVAGVAPGPVVAGELVERDGALRLATVHATGELRRLRVRALPAGTLRVARRIDGGSLADLDPFSGRPRDEPVQRCPLTALGAPVSSLACGDLAEHGIERLSVHEGALVADGSPGWARSMDGLLDGVPLAGVVLHDGALVVVGSTRHRVVVCAVDPATGRDRWRAGP